MANERYPIIEINDALRQTFFIPPPFPDPDWEEGEIGDPDQPIIDWWKFLDDLNPNWQIGSRKRFSLSTTNRDGDRVRDGATPYIPPIPEIEDEAALIRPVLYDNVNEFGIAATSTSAPITGIVVQYLDGTPTGLTGDPVEQGATGPITLGIAVYEVFLFVMNQDAPKSRLLRYMNWFLSEAVFFRDNTPQPLKDLIVEVEISDPVEAVLSGPFSEINRQATIGIVIEFKYNLLDNEGRGVQADDNIFDPELDLP